jgi:hypothetical protein
MLPDNNYYRTVANGNFNIGNVKLDLHYVQMETNGRNDYATLITIKPKEHHNSKRYCRSGSDASRHRYVEDNKNQQISNNSVCTDEVANSCDPINHRRVRMVHHR